MRSSERVILLSGAGESFSEVSEQNKDTDTLTVYSSEQWGAVWAQIVEAD